MCRGLRVSGHFPAFTKAQDAVKSGSDEIQRWSVLQSGSRCARAAWVLGGDELGAHEKQHRGQEDAQNQIRHATGELAAEINAG